MAIKQLTKVEFEERVATFDSVADKWKFKGSKPVIIDFYAEWCGPCRTFTPVIEEVSHEYNKVADFYKVDIDKEEYLSSIFTIRSVPTLILIPVNEKPKMVVGALQKADLKRAIEEILNKK